MNLLPAKVRFGRWFDHNFRAEDNLASLPWKVDLNCQVALDFFVRCLEKVKRCCTMVPKEKHHKNNSNQIARQRILSSNHHVFFLRIMGSQATLSLENPIQNPGSSSLGSQPPHAALGPPEKSKSSSKWNWYCFQNSACQDLQENPHQVWGFSRTLMHRLDCLCFLMELFMFFWGFRGDACEDVLRSVGTTNETQSLAFSRTMQGLLIHAQLAQSFYEFIGFFSLMPICFIPQDPCMVFLPTLVTGL